MGFLCTQNEISIQNSMQFFLWVKKMVLKGRQEFSLTEVGKYYLKNGFLDQKYIFIYERQLKIIFKIEIPKKKLLLMVIAIV